MRSRQEVHKRGQAARRIRVGSSTAIPSANDWALAPLADQERRDVLEVLKDRFDARSTIVASQLPVTIWHEYIGEPTIANAVLDRLVHNAHRIELKGESMRKNRSGLTKEGPSDK